LGRFIVDAISLGESARDQLVGGAILVAGLAFLTEVLFGVAERIASPRVSSSKRKKRAGAQASPAV
jgi:ABC-type proline/glycine betaine transport system permease subunit